MKQDSSSFASPEELSEHTNYSVHLENPESSGNYRKAKIISSDSRDLCLSDEFKTSIFLKNFLISSVNYENTSHQDLLFPTFDHDGKYLSKLDIVSISSYADELLQLSQLFEKIENKKSFMVSGAGSKISEEDLDFSYYSLALIEDKSGEKDLCLISFSRDNVAENFGQKLSLEIVDKLNKNTSNLLKIFNVVKSLPQNCEPDKSIKNASSHSAQRGSVVLFLV
jgi:hypothetical protein